MPFVISTDEPMMRITLMGTLTNEDPSALGGTASSSNAHSPSCPTASRT